MQAATAEHRYVMLYSGIPFSPWSQLAVGTFDEVTLPVDLTEVHRA